MRFKCPQCRRVFEASDAVEGRRVKCASCGTAFVVPQEPVYSLAKPARHACPHCDTSLSADAVICFHCGYNLQSGKMPTPEHDEEAVPGREESGPLWVRLIEFVGAWLPGLFRFWVLFWSVLLVMGSLVTAFICLFMVRLGVLLEAFVVGGFALMLYGQALAMMIQGETGFIPELLSEFDGRRWVFFLVLLFVPFIVLHLALRGLAGS